MTTTVLDGLRGVQRTFNLYAITLGVIGMGHIIRWLNDQFGYEQTELRVFDFVVHPVYFSAIIGLLFALFVVVLFLQMRFVSSALDHARGRHSELCDEALEGIRHFPWIACPFHASRLGLIIFWVLLILGCLILYGVSLSHILGETWSRSPSVFSLIGYVDAAILVGSVILLQRIHLIVKGVRQSLSATE